MEMLLKLFKVFTIARDACVTPTEQKIGGLSWADLIFLLATAAQTNLSTRSISDSTVFAPTIFLSSPQRKKYMPLKSRERGRRSGRQSINHFQSIVEQTIHSNVFGNIFKIDRSHHVEITCYVSHFAERRVMWAWYYYCKKYEIVCWYQR